ncbi:MAG: acyl-CoA thioesterase [Azovibrio sp.]
MSHTLTTRAYYADTDAGLVIHHARYIEFFERCRTEWLRSLGAAPQELTAHGLLFVIRDLHTQYLTPGRLDDLVELRLSVLDLGRSQLKLKQEAIRQPDGATLASSIIQLVCINLDTMKSTPVPDWLREQISPTP